MNTRVITFSYIEGLQKVIEEMLKYNTIVSISIIEYPLFDKTITIKHGKALILFYTSKTEKKSLFPYGYEIKE